MRLSLQIDRKKIQRTLAMVKVTAQQQTWTTPVTQAAQRLGAQQKGIAVVQLHTPRKQARALQTSLEALEVKALDLCAAEAITNSRTGLYQSGLLPDRQKHYVVEQHRWDRQACGALDKSTMFKSG